MGLPGTLDLSELRFAQFSLPEAELNRLTGDHPDSTLSKAADCFQAPEMPRLRTKKKGCQLSAALFSFALQPCKNLIQDSDKLSQKVVQIAAVQQICHRAQQITEQVSRSWLRCNIQDYLIQMNHET